MEIRAPGGSRLMHTRESVEMEYQLPSPLQCVFGRGHKRTGMVSKVVAPSPVDMMRLVRGCETRIEIGCEVKKCMRAARV